MLASEIVLRPGSAIVLAAFACAGAATAARADKQTFLVRVEGVQTSVVVAERETTTATGCTQRESGVERRTLTFASARPVPTTAVGGRLQAVSVPVTVRVSGVATRQTTLDPPACGNTLPAERHSCGPATFAANVRLRVAGNQMRLAGALVRTRDEARCAPAQATAQPFLVQTGGRFDPRSLGEPSARSVSVRASTVLVDRLKSGARRTTTVEWTLLLTRVP